MDPVVEEVRSWLGEAVPAALASGNDVEALNSTNEAGSCGGGLAGQLRSLRACGSFSNWLMTLACGKREPKRSNTF